MLSLLKIKNIALISDLKVEFAEGLNLLTGETGSGKSIIVDSLGALTGARVTSDLIKEGEESGSIEGLFIVESNERLAKLLAEAGIDESGTEIIIKREISHTGKNRVFVNNQLVTQGLLKEVGPFLADIHGQGEQATLFDVERHLEILDRFAETKTGKTKAAFAALQEVKSKLRSLKKDDADKLQLMDILAFQTEEIEKARLIPGEDEMLEEEKRKLSNVEQISSLADESYALLYEDEKSVVGSLDKVRKLVTELKEFDSSFGEYQEGVDSAHATLEELAIEIRDFRNTIEYSPSRLEEIESRLAEISTLTRKYGGTLEAVIEHFKESKERLETIQMSDKKQAELEKAAKRLMEEFVDVAGRLTKSRKAAAKKLKKRVEEECKSLALEKAVFETQIERRPQEQYSSNGLDNIEFLFSANPGESPKPLAKVASGGEASRLMLILKTAMDLGADEKTVVFDEVDSGVGGRVAEAVGQKLKSLSKSHQILCVTHQPQVASLADQHCVVLKTDDGKKTSVSVNVLSEKERLEEIARMLAGEEITEAARANAETMLKAGASN